jgi:Pyruvate/2-oxoacid:ferredoxin oxidoreductase delta subunit
MNIKLPDPLEARLSPKSAAWHGIPRDTIPWYPTVNHDKCIGCELCFVTCGRGVYDVHDHKAWPERQYDCMVGCTTCANICPAQAIIFPDKQIVQKVEREHKILAIVRKEAAAKHAKIDAEKARAQAEDIAAATVSRVAFHIAGEFGEKRFLVKMEALIKDRPFDVVNLKLEVPTLKGAFEKTPSHMNFEVTSTDQQDITEFLNEVRGLVRENQLVLINETRV